MKLKKLLEGLIYRVKSLFNWLEKMYHWFPVISKDHDWDHAYIFSILEYKLKRQAKYIGDHDRHTEAKRCAEIMLLCTRLIDKVKNEYYVCEPQDYLVEHMVSTPLSGEEMGYYEVNIITDHENLDYYFKKYPLQYKKVIELGDNNIFKIYDDDSRKKMIAFNMAHINHNRAKHLLFSIMNNHIENWWD